MTITSTQRLQRPASTPLPVRSVGLALLLTATALAGLAGCGSGSTASSARAITVFGLVAPSVTGTIDEGAKEVSLTVPHGTDVSALVATFQLSPGATARVGAVAQASGVTANDFSMPVTYTVVAEDGSTQGYVATVAVASSTAKDLTAFAFTAGANADLAVTAVAQVDQANRSVAVTLPGTVEVAALIPTFELSAHASAARGGIAQVSGTTPSDFGRRAVFTVTAQDGSTQDYTVSVTREFTASGAPISLTVPEGLTSLRVVAWGAAGGALAPYARALGAQVSSEVAVTPGEALQLRVGGVGGDGGGALGGPSFAGAGGWNGGGSAGPVGVNGGGGGGGGATDVRRSPYSLADRLVVAGGAGGTTSDGGAGGQDGGDGVGGVEFPGGRGATQTGPGAATTGATAQDGFGGEVGQGGAGGGGVNANRYSGGGGGGGLFGGGGGGCQYNGWGGGGGGGSSIGPAGTTYATGVDAGNDGHGKIAVTPLD